MKRIILLCNGGLSTGILVKRMKAAVKAQDFVYEISAAPASDAGAVGAEADLIFLGPQARFQMETVKKRMTCPVISIDPASYGTMNGEKVLNQVKRELGEAWWRI